MTGGMMFKGTPGPWYASDWGADNGEDKFTIEVRYPEILRPGQSSIWPGGVYKHQVASTEEAIFDRDTNLANANLIAAAPELLEAANNAVSSLESEFGRTTAEVNFPMLYAAIAKALGEQK